MVKMIIRAIEVSRPLFWPSTFLVFLLGVLISGNSFSVLVFLFAFLWSFPYSLWICSVNDQADIRSDTINQFKGGISGVKVYKSEIQVLKQFQWVSVLSILLPTLFTFNGSLWGTSIIAIVIPYLYSSYPVRLKERPPWDSVSNGLFVMFVFLSGYLFSGNVHYQPLLLPVSAALFLGVSAIHIIGALRDYSADKKAHVKTIATVYGQRVSAGVCGILFILLFILAQSFPIEFHVYALLGILVSTILFIKPGEKISFHLGTILVLSFFVVTMYSIIFNSWKF